MGGRAEELLARVREAQEAWDRASHAQLAAMARLGQAVAELVILTSPPTAEFVQRHRAAVKNAERAQLDLKTATTKADDAFAEYDAALDDWLEASE